MVEPITAHSTAPPSAADADAAPADAAPSAAEFFGNVLDVINPLQHIPVVSTIYRAVTGDEIAAPAKLAGGALFGGIIGVAAAAVSVVVKEATGADVGEHALAMVTGDDATPDAELLATGRPPPPVTSAPDTDIPAAAAAALATSPASAPAADPGLSLADLIAAEPIAPVTPGATGPAAAQRPPLLAQSTLPEQPADEIAAAFAPPPVQSAPAGTPPQPSAPQSATPPADWVGQAIAQAQAIDARTVDTPAADTAAADQVRPGAPQPWIAGAMLQALDKYEAMAVSRNKPSGPDDDI